MSSLRSLVPRAGFTLHSKQLRQRWLRPSIRHASNNPPPKPRVLEKPDKFRPPSHPSRIRSKPRYTGPPLSENERQAQKTRRYPHMMPAEGTFLHWFLSNRAIHVWITLSILSSLAFGVWFEDFRHNTPYQDLLPPNSMLFSHPIRFFGRWAEVYQMHVAYVSAETADRRKQKVDDVTKRSHYRKAHGLEQGEGVFGGWTAKTTEETLTPALREGGSVPSPPSSSGNVVQVVRSAVDDYREGQDKDTTYVDFEGNRQPVRKKWLGIW